MNEAYDSFLTVITSLYEKNCPLVKKEVEQKSDEKPWLTNGILNACKKKNVLYKDTQNKLTRIMRSNKNNYYSKLLEDNRSKKHLEGAE